MMTKTLPYRWFGIGKVPKRYRRDLELEGILHQEEGIPVTTTLRDFRAPGRVSVYRRFWSSGSIVLTQRRLIAFGGRRTAIHLPFDHDRFDRVRFAAEGDRGLLMTYSAENFLPDTTGRIELLLGIEDAEAFLAALADARG